jgi:membrane protein DedA with SNARE-associated domain
MHKSIFLLAGLFFGTFIHEDVTLAAGSFFIVEHDLPWPWVLAAVYIGVIVSDLTLYTLGAIAAKTRWLGRWLVDPRILHAKARLNNNLLIAIGLCQLTPGVMFPTYIACGWFGVPLRRYLGSIILMNTLYTPVVLFLMVVFGTAVLQQIGSWAWPLAIVIVTLAVIWHRLHHAATAGKHHSLKALFPHL